MREQIVSAGGERACAASAPASILHPVIIDIHTHAFPDELAQRAVPFLEEEGNVRACLDGRVSSLLASMDRSGIHASVVASIATKPSQFRSIFDWSLSISSDRIIPFPSVHPRDPEVLRNLGEIAAAGFRGVKLHPYYQDFSVDDEEIFAVYEELQRTGLALLLHTGFDIAYPHDRIADPVRTARVMRQFPGLKLITTHYGAWMDWDEVENHLLGKPIYMDGSYSIPQMGFERARSFFLRHPRECVVFGSDSPWGDQQEGLEVLRRMELSQGHLDAVLGGNARRLLGL